MIFHDFSYIFLFFLQLLGIDLALFGSGASVGRCASTHGGPFGVVPFKGFWDILGVLKGCFELAFTHRNRDMLQLHWDFV